MSVQKICYTLSIVPGQKDLTLKSLNIYHIVLEDSKCTLFIKELLKTTRQNFHQTPIKFRSYPDIEEISVIKNLHDYIVKTKNLRMTGQLTISLKK